MNALLMSNKLLIVIVTYVTIKVVNFMKSDAVKSSGIKTAGQSSTSTR